MVSSWSHRIAASGSWDARWCPGISSEGIESETHEILMSSLSGSRVCSAVRCCPKTLEPPPQTLAKVACVWNPTVTVEIHTPYQRQNDSSSFTVQIAPAKQRMRVNPKSRTPAVPQSQQHSWLRCAPVQEQQAHICMNFVARLIQLRHAVLGRTILTACQ